jgi:predicted metal-dependent hydrolase
MAVSAHSAALGVPAPFQVEVVRSARRKRTVGAQLRGDVLTITVPSWLPQSDEAHWVEVMTRRFLRQRAASDLDLTERARQLAARYSLPLPGSIRWVESMTTRWASCTPGTGAIRVSDRLAAAPPWVLDYVLMHEMAHLVHANHGRSFWALVHRYPKSERAIGYLTALSTLDLEPAGDARMANSDEGDVDGLDGCDLDTVDVSDTAESGRLF